MENEPLTGTALADGEARMREKVDCVLSIPIKRRSHF